MSWMFFLLFWHRDDFNLNQLFPFALFIIYELFEF